MKNLIRIFIALLYFNFLFACQQNEQEIGEEQELKIIPSNLSYDLVVIGKDATNLYGNGSGQIKINVEAENAQNYLVRFGDGNEAENTTGQFSHTFSQEGRNTYFIEVIAFSETRDFISDFVQTEILVATENNGPTNLVWADEFDYQGSPDASNWTYDIGRGNNGWGNGESQYYTSRSDNVFVDNGTLKIVAKKEFYSGAAYTSARLLTQGKFSFTYGKVEIRAKLPSAGGTWPALWMLGSNFPSVGWPSCGEIDIMEHVGNNYGKIQSAIHTPSSFGNTSNLGSININNIDKEFHVYSANWTPEKIEFAVDGVIYYTYNPSPKNSANWPFNNNQFLILNIAIGGTLGGAIDSNFQEDVMEIDYVRVYK